MSKGTEGSDSWNPALASGWATAHQPRSGSGLPLGLEVVLLEKEIRGNMTDDWVLYERRVAGLLGDFTNALRMQGLESSRTSSGQRNKIPGASGYEHQIDVSLECLGSSERRLLILCECKMWRRSINVAAVLAFLGRIVDIQEVYQGDIEAHIITPFGPQSGARKVADHYKIQLDYAGKDVGNDVENGWAFQVHGNVNIGAVTALLGDPGSEAKRTALAEYVAEVMEEANDVRAVTDIESRIAAGEEKVTDWDEADLDDLPA